MGILVNGLDSLFEAEYNKHGGASCGQQDLANWDWDRCVAWLGGHWEFGPSDCFDSLR